METSRGKKAPPRSARERLQDLEHRRQAIEGELSDPAAAGEPRRLADLGREHSELTETIRVARNLAAAENRLAEAEELLQSESDEEMRELAEADSEEAREQAEALTEELQLRLMPRDPLDERNLLLEIRAGTGGDEAALFAGDLLRMYSRYAEEMGWKVELVSRTESGLGGFREVIVSIKGQNAYSHLKYEGGVHRVQRVPVTETQGRIHTSAATVAVLPEAEETDLEIKDSEVRVDTMCASGPGGQGVNTTYSAVRLVHLPSGMIVSCQDERSQRKNLAKAMQVLRSRLLEKKMRDEDAARSASRKKMVGTGDRSERIRTYNFPQNRVTDHRINLTLYCLDRVVEGDLDQLVKSLRKAEMQELMEEMGQ